MGGARAANRGPGSPRSRVGEGAPPRADLGAGIAVAAAGSLAGPARRALGWAAARAAARAGAPCALPRPAAVPRNLQEAAGPGEWGEGALEGRWGPGEREADVPRGGARGKRGRGSRRAPGPCSHPARRAGVGGRRRCLPSASQIAIWRLPGRAGAAARATPMARFLAGERARSRSLSSLGTCPSASRGLLSMGNRASPRSQRAGSRRAKLGGQARRPRQLRAESASPHPRPLCPPQAESSPYLAPSPAAPTRAEPGPNLLRASAPITHPYCFAHTEYYCFLFLRCHQLAQLGAMALVSLAQG